MNFKKKLRDFFTLTKRSKGGFTLVELIVVIAILAILAGVAIPVYSGYVKKAEKAGDEQLLAAVNKAFTAAVSAAGDDITTITTATLDVVDGKVVANSLEVDDSTEYAADFAIFFAGNENSAFKGYSDIKYDPDLHVFKGVEDDVAGGAYADLTFDSNKIAQVKSSAFYTADGLGVDNLMNKVDYITTLAAKLADPFQNDGDGNGAWQMLSGYTADVIEAIGIELPAGFWEMDPAEQNTYLTEYNNLVAEKVAALEAQGGNGIAGWSGWDDAQKSMYAQNTILSNYAVLDAAEGMKGQDAVTILNTIKTTTNFTDLIKDSENKNGVAMASAAYGLYTAYAYTIEDPTERAAAIAKTNDPANLLKAMDDPGFRSYLEKPAAETDLAGYMAAMEMINSSATDEDAVRELMVNGFTDPALLAVIQQAMN